MRYVLRRGGGGGGFFRFFFQHLEKGQVAIAHPSSHQLFVSVEMLA